MKDVQKREDVYDVVAHFYSKVQKDDMLGPIFNKMISNWEEHYEHLTDFWESNVFMTTKYSGNPIKIHQKVDKDTGSIIEQKYFVQWLKLWFETIDSLFEGGNAQIMKNRARNMSTYIFIQMVQGRGKEG